jgi:hypothetical protein
MGLRSSYLGLRFSYLGLRFSYLGLRFSYLGLRFLLYLYVLSDLRRMISLVVGSYIWHVSSALAGT